MSRAPAAVTIEQGVAHFRAGRLSEAQAVGRTLLAERPDHSAALHLLGSIGFVTGRLRGARQVLKEAIAADPAEPAYYSGLGLVLERQGYLIQEIERYREALAIEPGFSPALEDLAELDRMAGEATSGSAEHAALRRDVSQLLLALDDEQTRTLTSLPLFTRYRRLLLMRPWNPPPPDDMDDLIARFAGGIDDLGAVRAYLAALLFAPAYRLPPVFDLARVPDALVEDVMGYLMARPDLFETTDDVGRYQDLMAALIDHIAGEFDRQPDSSLWRRLAASFIEQLDLTPIYFGGANVRELRRAHARFVESYLTGHGFVLDHCFPARPAGRRLRLGVIARNFVNATETYSILPVYNHLDEARFEVVLFSYRLPGDDADGNTANHDREMVYLDTNLSNAVEDIRARNLDILLFGTNLTSEPSQVMMLAAHRLAPIQVARSQSMATTGFRNIDYFISGELAEGEDGGQAHYTETLVKLPGTAYCFEYPAHPDASPNVIGRAGLELADNAVVFASGASLKKLGAELRDCWARILDAVPGSVLLLIPFSPVWSGKYPEARLVAAMAEAFASHGVASGRLRVVPRLANRGAVKQHLALADVYLDSFPFSGTHSIVDPLELGLPAVTMDGPTLRVRQGSSLLLDLDLAELVCQTPDDYVSRAVRLATDGDYRASLRRRIDARMRATPRFLDSALHSRETAKLFEAMVVRHDLG